MMNTLKYSIYKSLTALILILFSHISYGQFTSEIVISNRAKNFSKLQQINDTISIGLNEIGIFKIVNNHSNAVTYEQIAGTTSRTSNFIMFDYDKDGDIDIWSVNGMPAETADRYENTSGEFTYVESTSLFSNKALDKLDYNQDGVEDFILNNEINIWTGNSYEVQAELSPGLGNTINSYYVIDLDKDGYNDLISSNGINASYYRANQAGGFTRQILKSGATIKWANVMNTANGKMAIIFNGVTNNIERLDYLDGEIIYKEIHPNNISLQANQIIDLNGDGYDEVVCNFLATISIGQYDPLLDILIFRKTFFEDAVPQYDQALIQKYNNDYYAVTMVNSIVGNYKIENDYSVTKQSSFPLGIRFPTFSDVDGDGFIDIGNQHNSIVKRYMGSNEFLPIQVLPFADGSGCFEDYDSDGDNDYIKENVWYENEGELIFSDAQEKSNSITCAPTNNENNYSLQEISSDLNNDGTNESIWYDIVKNSLNFSNSNLDTVSLIDLENVGKSLVSLRTIDINNNGFKDIIFATEEVALIFLSTSSNYQFEDPIYVDNNEYNISNLEVVDINGDDIYEIVISTKKNIAANDLGYVRVYNLENSNLEEKYYYSGGAASGGHIVRVGDLNLDGIFDLVIYHENEIFAILFDSSLNGRQEYISKSLISGFDFSLMDLNNDGDLDIIAYCNDCDAPLTFSNDRYSYFLNNYIPDTVITEKSCNLGNLTLATQKDIDNYFTQFGGCTTIVGNLQIGQPNGSEWPDIEGINSFSNLMQIDGNLTLESLNKLDSLEGLNNLKSISGDLKISNYINGSLIGLDSLEYIHGNMDIYNLRTMFSSQNNLPFQNLEGISGNISIHNYNRTMFSFPSWANENFEGDIEFSTCFLSSAQFTNKITSCDGSITIKFCNLALPIKNLLSLTEDLVISSNEGNFDLGLIQDELVIDSALIVKQNELLTNCNVPAFCNHINSGRETLIHSNGELCELEDINCLIEPQDSVSQLTQLTLWPQPAHGNLFGYYNYDGGVEFQLKYKILNTTGNLVKEDEFINNASIEVSELSNGIYIINIYPLESNSNILVSKSFLVLK